MVNADRERLAQLCVEAALLVTKFHENMKPDCDLRLIKLDYIDSGSLEETQLIRGITIMKKSFSHENMPTKIQNVKLAVLSCALEAPRPKTKHTVNINSEQDFIQLKIVQASFYEKICTSIKNSGANAVICQWGIDHEVNDWLVYNNIVAVRWVVGDDIERIAMATGATICPRISELTSDKLGTAETMYIQQVSYSDGSNSGIIIEGCSDPRTCSILVRGTNQYMCEDTVRSLHDALCSVRNSMIETEVIPGGGASETELFVQINDKFIPQFVDKLQDEQWNEFQRDRMYQLIDVFKSYAESLLVIPLTLAENAGVVPVQFIQKLVLGHRQKQEESKYLGIALTEATSENLFEQEDEELMSILDMRKTQVVEMLSVKKNILEAATETACIILKVDQVIK
jgi:T-complex protein 1 subunit epsilon